MSESSWSRSDARLSTYSWSSASSEESLPSFANAAKLDSEWRAFYRQWRQPWLRELVGKQMPTLVQMIWQDEFVKLNVCPVDAARQSEDRALGPADEQAFHATESLIHAMLHRTHVSAFAMLLALYFVFRYRTLPLSEVGSAGSQYRMFVVGMLLAHKYSEDHPYSNRVWAQLSSIHVREINAMERDFLKRIDHRLSVTLVEFQRWVVALDRRHGWTGAGVQMEVLYRSAPLPLVPTQMPQITTLQAPPPVKKRNVYTHPVGPVQPGTATRRSSNVLSL
jgi:hypothetical protein